MTTGEPSNLPEIEPTIRGTVPVLTREALEA
jgi:hypothetical protein